MDKTTKEGKLLFFYLLVKREFLRRRKPEQTEIGETHSKVLTLVDVLSTMAEPKDPN